MTISPERKSNGAMLFGCVLALLLALGALVYFSLFFHGTSKTPAPTPRTQVIRTEQAPA